jgi:hypothetical protein
LDKNFKDKSIKAKESIVTRYIKRSGFSRRVSTHVAQAHFKETEMAAKFFIDLVRGRVSSIPALAVCNMDQTPIFYSFHQKHTLAPKGQKTIHIIASTNSTQRATLNVGVTLAGTMLKPMTIFKGTVRGTIARNELPTFPSEGLWACQDKAWCNEEMMLLWVDGPLLEWKEQVVSQFPNVVPIVVLDAFKVHMMASVVARIQSHGMEVIHIPAGCTYLCQPVDVGINRPIKHQMALLWEEWMVNENLGKNLSPPRKLIAQWIIATLKSIDETVIKNAWRKKGYEWVL